MQDATCAMPAALSSVAIAFELARVDRHVRGFGLLSRCPHRCRLLAFETLWLSMPALMPATCYWHKSYRAVPLLPVHAAADVMLLARSVQFVVMRSVSSHTASDSNVHCARSSLGPLGALALTASRGVPAPAFVCHRNAHAVAVASGTARRRLVGAWAHLGQPASVRWQFHLVLVATCARPLSSLGLLSQLACCRP